MKTGILLAIILVPACTTTLNGRVSSSGPKQINTADARINVTRLEGDVTGQGMDVVALSSDGSFSLDNELEDGTYLLEALVPGFKPNSVRVNGKQTDPVIFELESSGDDVARPISLAPTLDAGRGAGGATILPPQL